MAEIEFDDVVKRYPDGFEAVKHMDLQIRDAEFMILVGPSGCGKSTALRMIAGLEDISEGDLKIGGEVVNDLAPKDRDIAMVFQNYALYPHMTVRENMGFALKLRKAPEDEIKRRVDEAARVLELEQHLERKPANLSGGQRQRVDSPRELYEHPRNIFVAGFIGSPAMNFFSGTLEGETVRTPMGAIPLTAECRRMLESRHVDRRDVIVGIRPEDFEDAQFAPEGHSGWTFEAPIELTESMGSEIYAHFDFDAGEAIEHEELRELQEDAGTSDVPQSSSGHAVARVDAASGVRTGERAKLWLNTDKIHLFNPSDGLSLTRAQDGAAVGA